MSVLQKMVSDGSKFLKAQIDSIKNTNEKELAEIKKLENKLKKFEKNDKEPISEGFWSVKGSFTFWLVGLLIVFIGYLGFKSLDIIYLILTAFILSIGMEAIINLFQRIRINRGFSIAIAYIFLIIFIIPGLFLVGLFLLDILSQFLEKFISWVIDFKVYIESNTLDSLVNGLPLWDSMKKYILANLNPELFQQLINEIQKNITQIVGTSTEYAKNVFNFLWNFSGSILTKVNEVFLNIGIVLTLSVLFSTQKDSVVSFLSGLGGDKRRDYLRIKFEKIYKKLGLWLKSQLILCILIFTVTFIALSVMKMFGVNIPQIRSLATIAGLTEIIPYIGPILGGIPAVFVVLLHNGIYPALIMIGVIFFIQRLENNVLIPLVMNKTLGVNPLTIFISMIIGGLIMGFAGIFLAVPIAVIITMFTTTD